MARVETGLDCPPGGKTSMTRYPDLFAALAARFGDDEVKTRSQSGREFSYITARTAMNRLDNVLGPENWWDRFTPSNHSVLCELSIRLPDGQILTKQDAGGNAGMADPGDDDKSAYSDAFKRAAAKFGVGRYLYQDGVPDFGREQSLFVTHPARPEAFLKAPPRASAASDVATSADSSQVASRSGTSTNESKQTPEPPTRNGSNASKGASRRSEVRADEGVSTPTPKARKASPRGNGTAPKTGRALFAWVRDQEERHGIKLLSQLDRWGSEQEFPSRMLEWDAEQVRLGYQEASRIVQDEVSGTSQMREEALMN